MKPRECWSVLANKAEDVVALNQQRVKAARENLEKLEASKERLLSMSNEYAEKIREKEKTTQSLIESNNARQFVLQLLQLSERLDKDRIHAQAQLELAFATSRTRALEDANLGRARPCGRQNLSPQTRAKANGRFGFDAFQHEVGRHGWTGLMGLGLKTSIPLCLKFFNAGSAKGRVNQTGNTSRTICCHK